MKKFLSTLALSMFLVVAAFVTSCEGPEGPAGPKGADGANGANGQDAQLKCATCHNDTLKDVNLAFAQYNLSKHGTGEVYIEEAGRINCGGCHSGDGFREALALGKDDPTSLATSKIGCRTCHVIHKNYDNTDWALSTSAGFNLRYKGDAADAAVDFKTGNLCGKCHQARTYTRGAETDNWTASGATSMYSRFGPHYGTSANVVAMKGLNEIAGPETYPSANVHGNLTKGCVSCHMGSNPTNPAAGGHTFKMTVAQMSTIESCKTCHPDGLKTDKANEIKALLAEYRQLLVDKNLIISTEGEPGEEDYNILGEYCKLAETGKARQVSKELSSVVLNYLYIAKDRSLGVHNPRYVYAIAKNGVEYLKNN